MEVSHSDRAAQISSYALKDIEDVIHPNSAALLRWDESARQFLKERIASRLRLVRTLDSAQIFFDHHVHGRDLGVGIELLEVKIENTEGGPCLIRREAVHPRILFINRGMVRRHNDQFPISLPVPKGRRDRMTVVSAGPVSLGNRIVHGEDIVWTDGPGEFKTIAEVEDPPVEAIRKMAKRRIRRDLFVNRGVIYWESFRNPQDVFELH